MQVAMIAVSAALLLTGPQQGATSGVPRGGIALARQPKTLTLPGCMIDLFEDRDVAAQEAGILQELRVPLIDTRGNPVLRDGQPVYEEVCEGVQVRKGQILGRIDDRLQAKEKLVAQYRHDVAKKEAGNDVSVRYAQAAQAVASAELDQAKEADSRHRGTVPENEMRRMALSLRQASLQIEQAQHDLAINVVSVKVREAEMELADLQIERRKIIAPIDGMVVERYREVGEWVTLGEPVLRIIRIDRVKIKGFAPLDRILPAQVEGQPVTITLDPRRAPVPAAAQGKPIAGVISFVDPIIKNDGFMLWAEVKNIWIGSDPNDPLKGSWLLRPGLTADMHITLHPVPLAAQTGSGRASF